MNADVYVGRFAPSPTGPLHFGSLVTAVASFLAARQAGGRWLLRIEDLDPPRESAAAPALIKQQLLAFGLHWDGDVLYQSTRTDAYAHALDQLTSVGLTFPCICSRKSAEGIYHGRCRNRTSVAAGIPFATRIKVDPSRIISFNDLVMGPQRWHLGEQIGDFVIRRKDGLFAYQLAVVVDDAFQGVTQVVRGNDLIDSTPRQIFLGEALGLERQQYAHCPVILGADGKKLSKQAHAEAIDLGNPLPALARAIKALGQPPSPGQTISRVLRDAVDAWDPARIPGVVGIHYASL